jgi:hypothetical protein
MPWRNVNAYHTKTPKHSVEKSLDLDASLQLFYRSRPITPTTVGIKSDQPIIAALHQISSPPADLSSSHSRSSLLGGAFGSQWASSSSTILLNSAPGLGVNGRASDCGSGASSLDFRLATLDTQVLTPSWHAQIRATSWEETNFPWPRVSWASYEHLSQAKTRSTGRRHPGIAGSASAI